MKTKIKVVSDEKLGQFILNCMRIRAKIDVMVALDKLKKFLRKKETMIFHCAICDKIYLIEDSYTCQRCGKSVCADHGIAQMNTLDNWEIVCTECLEQQHDRI